MNVAFKEWAVVDEALGRGEQIILLRKGGIHERQGRFEVEHDAFFVYPTHEHQRPEFLKVAWAEACRTASSERAILIRHLVRVADVLHAPPSPDAAPTWDQFHVYSPSLIAARYAYRPEQPLYVLIGRVYRLPEAVTIEDRPEYAGCHSWVTLIEDLPEEGIEPVVDDASFNERAESLRRIFRATPDEPAY